MDKKFTIDLSGIRFYRGGKFIREQGLIILSYTVGDELRFWKSVHVCSEPQPGVMYPVVSSLNPDIGSLIPLCREMDFLKQEFGIKGLSVSSSGDHFEFSGRNPAGSGRTMFSIKIPENENLLAWMMKGLLDRYGVRVHLIDRSFNLYEIRSRLL